MTDLLDILRRNFITPIVIAILSLALILLILGEGRDAWFISVVIVLNTVFAVVQEIRAQRALKKLELMSAPRARKQLEDGTFVEVMYDQLIAGDVIQLQSGDEIPADATLEASHGLEVDESMLTGESAAVEKHVKDTVFAASAVVAGTARAVVIAVGTDSKAGVMTAQLKRYKPELTPLQRNINLAITILTYGALGLALLIGIAYSLMGEDLVRTFKAITAGATTVIPEGLLLASTLLLAFGSLKLAAAKVLPQKLSAIEAMALLNVLCVDKTGTLTSPDVKFERFVWFGEEDQDTLPLVGIVARETSAGNSTGDALIAALPQEDEYDAKEILAFSSQRKLSGVRVKYRGSIQTVLMGAPEFLGKLASLTHAQKKQVQELAASGNRILLVASFDDHKTKLKELADKSGTALGLLVLSNELRDGVVETVKYLQGQGVSMRVISGDNPATVSYVATRAGIENPGKIITGAELEALSEDKWVSTVRDTTIFARVLPEQKERLIATFKKQHKFTGMVGDGVNDALALKKADLGVAMYAGAAASRRVADIVLLNNSFTSLPMGMKLGNRIMQAIEVISILFFHKIIYGVVLLVATLAVGLTYPFEPRHVTFMNMFLVTMPTIMWTLFPPSPNHRINPRKFWQDTLRPVAPIAILSGLGVAFIYSYLLLQHPGDRAGVATTTVIVATFFGVYLVFLASRILNVTYDRTAKLARILYLLAVIFVASVSLGFGFSRDFFDFTSPNWQNSWPALLLIANIVAIQWWLAQRASKKLKKRI
ncbi:HAD-IC family P-type ATPase [Candidatus Saccharibacteria bacterium]|nr:HAD-IC family P-type ATPase [Candidatus Saccharibacteria bacterium]MBH1972739.1 HAD-IC family P-type ATPase [Candidatus Saccharibacteria bacterium]MBH1990941.1 HAD-IC family P-type ATPase [Candidatus Saccharibacteria bacterium]